MTGGAARLAHHARNTDAKNLDADAESKKNFPIFPARGLRG